VKDLYPEQKKSYQTGTPLNDDDVAAPCGFLAKNLPSDTFNIQYETDNVLLNI